MDKVAITDLSPAPMPATVEADVGRVKVSVTYDAARVSAAWLRQAATLPRRALAEAIIEWNVTDAHGAPAAPPPDAEGEARIAAWEEILAPLSIRGVIEPIVAAIVDDWRGGGKAGGVSGAG